MVADTLAKLPESSRLALVALAIAQGIRVSTRAWETTALRLGLRQENRRYYTTAQFEALIDSLVDAGAVHRIHADCVLDDRWIAPVVDGALTEGKLHAALQAVGSPYGSRDSKDTPTLGMPGDLRVGAALGRPDLVERGLRWLYGSDAQRDLQLHYALGDHPTAAWLAQFPTRTLRGYLGRVIDASVDDLRAAAGPILEAATRSDDAALRARTVGYHALRGDTHEAGRVLAPLLAVPRPDRLIREAAALVALCAGDVPGARAQLALPSKGKPDRGPYWLNTLVLLLELTTETAVLEQLQVRIDTMRRSDPRAGSLSTLANLVAARRGRSYELADPALARTWTDVLTMTAQLRWLAPGDPMGPVDRVAVMAQKNGFAWIARQLETMTQGELVPGSLRALWQPKEPWELTLVALDTLSARSSAVAVAERPRGELHWFVELYDDDEDDIALTARWVTGSARRGKEISVARLVSGEGLVLRPEDHAIVARLATAKKLHESLKWSALALLAGHPHVYDASGAPLAVHTTRPVLSTRNDGGKTTVQIEPPELMTERVALERAPGSLTLVQHDDESLAIARILDGRPLQVPKEGLGSLLRTLGGLADRIDVRTSGLAAQEEPADSTLHVQLRRTAQGLVAALRIVPAADAAPRVPGHGSAVVVQQARDGLRSLRRDLAAERAALTTLLDACPVTAELVDPEATVRAPDLASALEVLGELSAFTAEGASPRVVLAWREGTPLRVTTSGISRARVAITGDTDWLTVQGELSADDGTVIAMRELLAGLAGGVGRFVPLGADRYLALTTELRQRLAALAHVQQLGTKKGLGAALLPALESVTAGLEVEWSKSLQKRRRAMQEAAEARPRVPRLLQAELRDYQREGFELLSRQCAAGTGVVLADDMGLGKTVQTIAVLLERRAKGPALVVAPTSVLRNWEAELGRFAPSLRVHRFAEGDRARLVETARPGDVVLASYGLLPTAPELATRSWATLVFDEAHALKNAATQRWKAASSLVADARIALTGTPVENHVGELHALFDVIAPGVLGSRAAFQRVFAVPIGKGDRSAASTLRHIVRPLVLRRTKAQVLTELPPKTELLELVTASDEHLAFYEALRQTALEKLQNARKSGPKAGRDRISVLAEITRLRRAAIDPRLVGGASAPSGSKLDRLAELLDDLRAEGHRALVFSQFLEVLDLARARLEPAGFGCLRLDGTMTATARAAVVDAFQGGEGDVLLASLKAGGVGVNLTAADYVIHLDPWWNPAVEDQATDRAHRMGQQRPVTVVRLVTEGTLEEKVLSLHADKRRVFQETVGDADGTGVLDVEKLVELLGE